MNISVVIPAYDPDNKMVEFIDGLIEYGIEDIIVVNDGSDKETLEYFEQIKSRPQITLLAHDKNLGKGAALKTAFSYLVQNRKDADCAVCADADGQHTVRSIDICLKKYEENPGTVIIGGRDFSEGGIPLRSAFGNKVSSFIYRFAVGIRLKDTQSGLRVIPAQYFELFSSLKGERYEYETQMLIAIANKKIPYIEVPIATIYEKGNKSSHFRPVVDSLRIYLVVLKYFLKFALSSLSCYFVDMLIYAIILFIIEGKVATGVQVLICAVSARVVSSFCNYMINRKAVFKSTDNVGGTTWRYYTLAVCQLAASYLLIFLFTDVLNVQGAFQLIVKLIVDIVLFIFSYQIQRLWVFKNRKV